MKPDDNEFEFGESDRLPGWAGYAVIFVLCAGAWVAIWWALSKCAGT